MAIARAGAASIQAESMLRVLREELKDGCRNRMVMGGLDGLVENFRQRLSTAADPDLRAKGESAAALLAGYGSMGEGERETALRQAIEVLSAVAPPSVGEKQDESQQPRVRALTTSPASSAPVRPRVPRPLPRPTRPGALSTVESIPAPMGLTLDSGIDQLKGVGEKRSRLFNRLGLHTLRNLLFHFPARHIVYPPASPISELFFQAEGSVVGNLDKLEVEPLPRNLKRFKGTISDDTGSVTVVWLRGGYGNLGIQPNQLVAISGKISHYGRLLSFDNPDFEAGEAPPVHTRGLVPVYPLTAGLSDKEMRFRIHWVLERFANQVPEPLPTWVLEENQLLPIGEALRAVHFPTTHDAYERARRRFAFEELLTIQTIVLQRRQAWQEEGAPPLPRRDDALQALRAALPFKLTDAQRRVTDEILADLEQPLPMTRLVQGEVGSGKTAVAALALLNAVASGFQGALMAPTEILAEQHFATLTRLFDAAGDALEPILGHRAVVEFLTGSVKGKRRTAVYDAVAGGGIDILVGTQALIQEKTDFARLGLVIVDEQHRFGVKQRVLLRRKTQDGLGTPHLLVMTATPIPRTLALSLYGDLDLSVIDQMPPGRQVVKTVLLGADERRLAYEHIRREVKKGRQAFLICPLVEESEVLEAKAATEEFERLRTGELADLRLGLLHGRMKPADKDAIMRQFRDREFDVLVSTAVVEVGVDIPNATVMLIEGAERFGLAQLHQFRGRVGRGEHAATCILLTDIQNPQANDRLRVVERSSNGLELAEHDLRLRGPGDYFGVRQSGFPDLKVARLDDAMLVEAARGAARRLLETDPLMEHPDHAGLREHLHTFVERVGEPS